MNKLPFIITLLVLSSCATPQVVVFNDSFISQPTNLIDVYKSSVPEFKYIEIAEISYYNQFDDDQQKNIDILKSKARELGADAILISGPASFDIHGQIHKRIEDCGLKAIAIKYLP